MKNLIRFDEAADQEGHYSLMSKEEFGRRLRSTAYNGYSGTVHPSIAANVLRWREIYKSPTTTSLYSTRHDRTDLTLSGWSDKTMRMSDHWNNSTSMPARDFLRSMSKFNDSIPTHFYTAVEGWGNWGILKLDLSLQKRVYAGDSGDSEDDPAFLDNRAKMGLVLDAHRAGLDFDAVIMWHNVSDNRCCLAIRQDNGYISRPLVTLSDITVRQYTLRTNVPVENETHWTIARYNKQRNLWIVQDSKPKGDPIGREDRPKK